MGYASFVCSNSECTHTKTICFGCKSRRCNTCGKKLTDQWIANQKALPPNTEWQHITFTMPDLLWKLFKLNRTLPGKLSLLSAKSIQTFAGKKRGDTRYFHGPAYLWAKAELECSYPPLCDPWRTIRRQAAVEISLLYQKCHHACVALQRD